MSKKYKMNIGFALRGFMTSKQFRQQIESGRYLYVQKRICLNQPQYIQWNGTEASLTDYALKHQGECCLHPKLSTPKAHNQDTVCTGSRRVYMTRQRRSWSSRAFRYQLPVPKRLKPILGLTKKFSAVRVLSESLPNNFSQMLDKLIESKNMTEEELAESSNLSEKTIQRLRNHEPKRVTLETVLQLCIGLHLHPVLSEYLLRAAGQHFMDTKLHTMYKFLLYTCYDYSVDACNELLESQGFPILGKPKK